MTNVFFCYRAMLRQRAKRTTRFFRITHIAMGTGENMPIMKNVKEVKRSVSK